MNEELKARIDAVPGRVLESDTSNQRLTVTHDSLYKVIVVGDPGVGKTALLRRLKTNQYACDHASTIGVVSSKFEMMLQDESHVKLQLWDTAG